jgi:hypothetical protein
MNEITKNQQPINEDVLNKIFLNGDIKALSDKEVILYMNAVANKMGLDTTTHPINILEMKKYNSNEIEKKILYINKDGAYQLAKNNSISITKIETKYHKETGIYEVVAYGQDKIGRQDCSMSAVYIGKANGEHLANLLMKAETKAKRRLILSLCGTGLIDESEAESIRETKAEIIETKNGKNETIDVNEIKSENNSETIDKHYNPDDTYENMGTLIKDKENLFDKTRQDLFGMGFTKELVQEIFAKIRKQLYPNIITIASLNKQEIIKLCEYITSINEEELWNMV